MYLSAQIACALPLPKSLQAMLKTARNIQVYGTLNIVKKRDIFWDHSLWGLGHVPLFKIQFKSVSGTESASVLRQKGKKQTNSFEPEGPSSEYFQSPTVQKALGSRILFNLCGTMDEIHTVNGTKCDITSSEIFKILLQDRRYIEMGQQEVRLGRGGA